MEKAVSDQLGYKHMSKKNALPIAFVHSADYDGMASAALLKKYFNGDIEIHPINYGDKEFHSDTAFLDAFDVKGRDVFVCDFSFKPNLFKKIIDLSNQTTWLDHHASAVEDVINSAWYKRGVKDFLKIETEEAEEFIRKLDGLWIAEESVPYSGAYLTWAWLFNNKNPGFIAKESIDENGNVVRSYILEPIDKNSQWEKCPTFLKGISAFDTFGFTFFDRRSAFIQQYGMKAVGLGFESDEMWKALLADPDKDELVSYEDIANKQKLTETIESNGKAVLDFEGLYQIPRINAAAYPVKMEVNGKKLRGLALNVNGYNSEVFEPIYDPEKTDFFIEYYYKNGMWQYGVYVPEDKIEKVSAVDIIRSFDETGGGHRSAAGGRSEKLLKELQS